MPSTKKTPNLQLNQWVGNDFPKWEDRNADNLKLDAAIGNLANLNTSNKTDLVKAINEANASGNNPPYIGANGNWYVWGETSFIDTGISAQGPKGQPGTGNNWYTGTAISDASEIPTAYPTGISGAQAGDMYLNVGSLPDIGRIYRCTLGGDENTALWIYAATVRGADGTDGRGIVSIARTSGTGAPGTTDTYTITYSDETTDTFDIYNGANGAGTGDMQKSVYDPQGKNADAFSRASHTGTQPASTISDFASAVRATLLDGLSTVASAAIAATDSILTALAKLQAQITGHGHGNINSDGTMVSGDAGDILCIMTSGGPIESRSRSSAGVADRHHTHGNITDDGKIGTDSGKVITTTTGGVLQAQSATDASLAGLDANGKVKPEQTSARIVDVSASKTLALTDAGCQQKCTNTAAITLTIDTNANVAFPVGTEIEFVLYGAGSVTIAGASGVTLKSENDYHTVSTQNHIFAIKQEATDEWLLAGMEE